MDVILEFLLQILFEALFEGVIEGLFDLARGSRRQAERRAELAPDGPIDVRSGAEREVEAARPLDDSRRAAVFGALTVLTSLALGTWRGVARGEDGAGFGLAVAIAVAVVCAVAALRRRRAHVQEAESSMFTSTGRSLLPSWISSSLTTSRLVWFAVANAVFSVAYVAALVFAPTT